MTRAQTQNGGRGLRARGRRLAPEELGNLRRQRHVLQVAYHPAPRPRAGSGRFCCSGKARNHAKNRREGGTRRSTRFSSEATTPRPAASWSSEDGAKKSPGAALSRL